MKKPIEIRRHWHLALVAITALSFGCDELLQAFAQPTGPRQLSDDDSFKHLRKDRTAAPETDVSAVQAVIADEVALAQGDPRKSFKDGAVIDLLRRTTQARLVIDEDAFERVDFEDWGLGDGNQRKGNCSYDMDPGTLQHDDYMIPSVDKVPVRNQGRRGTCAAFAGVGMIEYTALHTVGQNLPTLDLSEQRFYWMSKTDCQGPSGCECPGCAQGSWYGTGFETSEAADHLDIPLETDCPYNPEVGKNDTQYPQTGSCEEGAVGVTGIEQWCGVDDIVSLLERGFAVPYASPLSNNWERNDGLITLRDFSGSGDTVHAGGHAYLIVGYKKLPNMPDEGGMCFYIKNSWGAGWGANGYACMTPAWMKEVTFDGYISYQQPVVTDLQLREDLLDGELPPDNDEAEDETEPDVPDDESDDDKLPPEPEPEPAPDPPPAVEYEPAVLYGPSEDYYKVEVADHGDELWVRGVLRDGEGESSPVKTEMTNGRLYVDGDQVGKWNGHELRLCTAEWGHLCSLRYRAKDKRMYIQFRDDDLRTVKGDETAVERGDWYEVPLGGPSYGVFIPTAFDDPAFLLNPKTFIKVGNGAPARLSLRPESVLSPNFDIKLMGQKIGQLKVLDPLGSSFCSGDFANDCNVFARDTLHIVPRNNRRGK